MSALLAGKVAIVTGAAAPRGIGAAYARALAEAGARVVLADLDAEAAAARARELAAAGLAAHAIPVDVTSEASVAALAAATAERFGGIDILVNNAALMAEIPMVPMTELPLDVWRRVLEVNVTGALLCVRAVLPEMKKRGAGKVVNQSSGGAFMPSGAYGVSKLALVSLTVSLARELAPWRINVNAIAPGFVQTEAMERCSPPEVTAMIRQTVPLRGVGEPTDLVGALLFLVSSASDWVTGQTLNVDGGWCMRI